MKNVTGMQSYESVMYPVRLIGSLSGGESYAGNTQII